MKEGCRKAFQKQPQRIVTPMYSCNIVVSNEVLGEFFKHITFSIFDDRGARFILLFDFVFFKNI